MLALSSDLTDADALFGELADAHFDYVVHLAAISAVTHGDLKALYDVNLFGTLNLLAAVLASKSTPLRLVIASSANIYGNAQVSPIDEEVCPDPVNHYAMSKLAMEQMVKAQSQGLPVLYVRPFNYTGVGHDERFVIPKIVSHFSRRMPTIELGNMQVEREFNDVRTVCEAYLELLDKGEVGQAYNVCSGQAYSLHTVLSVLGSLSGHQMSARVNPEFVRPNEVNSLCGDPRKLEACIGPLSHPPLEDTLRWMLKAFEA